MSLLAFVIGLIVVLILLVGWSLLRIAAWADHADDQPEDSE